MEDGCSVRVSSTQRCNGSKRLYANATLRILPVLALLFLCSFIDRTNVGNAKILGLEADIHINDHQYAIGLCVFYATYIASELPSNLVLKKVSPKIWLPGRSNLVWADVVDESG